MANTASQPTAGEGTTSYAPFIETSSKAGAAAVRAAMAKNGYVFQRGLIPVDAVLALRRDILELCRDAGWLDPSRELMDAVARQGQEPLTEGKGPYMDVYRKILKLPRFRELPSHPALMESAQKLLNGEVLVHPRRIGRVTFPNNVIVTTPPHQDHFYIRGTVETYSCWVPLGACPVNLGGLAVDEGSHKQQFIDHSVRFLGAVGGYGVPVDDAKAHWHTSSFEAGDAIFFHAFTVHKALPNLSGDRLRISTDNRYQRPKDEIDPSSLRPHYDLT